MSFFNDLVFKIKKPEVIIITGKGRDTAKAALLDILNKAGKDIFIPESDLKDDEKIKFYLKNSSFLILAESGPEGTEAADLFKKTAKDMPENSCLIFNFDDEAVRMAKNDSRANILTFGFEEGADLKASDVAINGKTNFKINYEGSIVPVWMDGPADKERIYCALLVASCALRSGLNLVEISQALEAGKF